MYNLLLFINQLQLYFPQGTIVCIAVQYTRYRQNKTTVLNLYLYHCILSKFTKVKAVGRKEFLYMLVLTSDCQRESQKAAHGDLNAGDGSCQSGWTVLCLTDVCKNK